MSDKIYYFPSKKPNTDLHNVCINHGQNHGGKCQIKSYCNYQFGTSEWAVKADRLKEKPAGL